jgi:hypothetical protein
MLFWRKNFEDGNCPRPGLFAASFLIISSVKPIEKYFAFDPGLGLNVSSNHRV